MAIFAFQCDVQHIATFLDFVRCAMCKVAFSQVCCNNFDQDDVICYKEKLEISCASEATVLFG